MRLLKILLIVSICMSFFSCGNKTESAEKILLSIMNECAPLPEGEIYLYGAEEGASGYLSPEIKASLYGEDNDKYEKIFADSFCRYACLFTCRLRRFCRR